jgi:hypothetical protein
MYEPSPINRPHVKTRSNYYSDSSRIDYGMGCARYFVVWDKYPKSAENRYWPFALITSN